MSGRGNSICKKVGSSMPTSRKRKGTVDGAWGSGYQAVMHQNFLEGWAKYTLLVLDFQQSF